MIATCTTYMPHPLGVFCTGDASVVHPDAFSRRIPAGDPNNPAHYVSKPVQGRHGRQITVEIFCGKCCPICSHIKDSSTKEKKADANADPR